MKADILRDFIGIQRNVGGVEVDHKNGSYVYWTVHHLDS